MAWGKWFCSDKSKFHLQISESHVFINLVARGFINLRRPVIAKRYAGDELGVLSVHVVQIQLTNLFHTNVSFP